jgi:hypothetical protein
VVLLRPAPTWEGGMEVGRRTTVALVLAALTGVWMLGLPEPAAAEPYMAIREGRKCGACHVNVTGSGMRTLLANTHLKEITHYRDIIPGLDEAGEVFNGQITNFFSVGGDIRLDDSIVFQDEPDAQGLVPHKAFRGNVEKNIFDLRRATTYFLFDLVPGALGTYVDVSWAPGGVTAREVFALLRSVLPWKGWVKGGRFFLDYGLRTENDNLFSVDDPTQNVFVRGRTGTDFTGNDEGLEIGFEPGVFHFSTSVTDGSPGDANVRVTSNAYAMLRRIPVIDNAILGASFLWLGPGDQERYVYGFYAGSNLGPFEYQAEIDFVHDDRQSSGDAPARAVGNFLAYAEVNYLLLDWINTKAIAEYSDNDGVPNSPASQQNRFAFGIEPFIGRFLQTRLFYSIANGPKNVAETNQNRIILELHAFF